MIKSLSVLLPAYGGQLTVQTCTGLLESCSALKERGIDTEIQWVTNESLVQRARNTLSHLFLAHGKDAALFIDADVGFTWRDVIGLIEASESKDIVCAPYPKKGYDVVELRKAAYAGRKELLKYGTHYAINIGIPPREPDRRSGNTVSYDFTLDHGCIPILDAATGFMLIKRDVFIHMASEMPEIEYLSDDPANRGEPMMAYFDCQIEEGTRRYLSEDYLFSRRASKLGYTIWCYLPANLSHTGNHTFYGDVLSKFDPLPPKVTESSLPEENNPLHARYMTDRYTWAAEKLRGSKRIADACSGPGYGMPILAKYGAQVVGFDRDPENKRKAQERGFGEVVLGDVTGHTFDGFDAVCTIESLEHLPDPVAWLRGFAPSVKRLALSTPCIPTRHLNDFHVSDFSYEEILRLMQALGWTVKAHQRQNDDVIMCYSERA